MELSDIVNEMHRRKVSFEPNDAEYYRYCFEYNCQLLESMGMIPSDNLNTLRLSMKAYAQRDLEFINEYYIKYGRRHTLKVPTLDSIPEHIRYTLLRYHKKIKNT